MIKTFYLLIYTKERSIEYMNLSRTAVKYFIEWHKENPNFYGYHLEEN